jgi:hypothetical protein
MMLCNKTRYYRKKGNMNHQDFSLFGTIILVPIIKCIPLYLYKIQVKNLRLVIHSNNVVTAKLELYC